MNIFRRGNMHFAEAICNYCRGYMHYAEAIFNFAEAICSFCENIDQLSPVEAGAGTELGNKKINIFWPKMVKFHKFMIGMTCGHGSILRCWESTFLLFAEAICISQRLYEHLTQRLYAFCRGYIELLQRLHALCRGYMQFLWEYRPTQSSWSWSWDWAWQ